MSIYTYAFKKLVVEDYLKNKDTIYIKDIAEKHNMNLGVVGSNPTLGGFFRYFKINYV